MWEGVWEEFASAGKPRTCASRLQRAHTNPPTRRRPPHQTPCQPQRARARRSLLAQLARVWRQCARTCCSRPTQAPLTTPTTTSSRCVRWVDGKGRRGGVRVCGGGVRGWVGWVARPPTAPTAPVPTTLPPPHPSPPDAGPPSQRPGPAAVRRAHAGAARPGRARGRGAAAGLLLDGSLSGGGGQRTRSCCCCAPRSFAHPPYAHTHLSLRTTTYTCAQAPAHHFDLTNEPRAPHPPTPCSAAHPFAELHFIRPQSRSFSPPVLTPTPPPCSPPSFAAPPPLAILTCPPGEAARPQTHHLARPPHSASIHPPPLTHTIRAPRLTIPPPSLCCCSALLPC